MRGLSLSAVLMLTPPRCRYGRWMCLKIWPCCVAQNVADTMRCMSLPLKRTKNEIVAKARQRRSHIAQSLNVQPGKELLWQLGMGRVRKFTPQSQDTAG